MSLLMIVELCNAVLKNKQKLKIKKLASFDQIHKQFKVFLPMWYFPENWDLTLA